jgi:hypothetical protein
MPLEIKQVEEVNAQLKRIVADLSLGKEILLLPIVTGGLADPGISPFEQA